MIIGILGAGQLGKMLAEAAKKLGHETSIFAPDPDPIAANVATKFTAAEYTDTEALKAFADNVDVITLEFENVPVHPLREVLMNTHLHKNKNLADILEITQHRIKEKTLANSLGIKTAPFMAVNSRANLDLAIDKVGTPGILKTCTDGYDGKGQWKIETDTKNIPLDINECIYEGFVNFEREISVIVVRAANGEIQCFEPVENVHKNHILHTTTAPANIDKMVAEEAINIAKKLAVALEVVGVLAVEMFVTSIGEILVNEMAPRPHNSGHWSIDGCNISQFEQTIRAITGMPLFEPKRLYNKVVMTNLIGDDVLDLSRFQNNKNAHIHIYGKKDVRVGRKMGHVTETTELLPCC